MFLIFYYRESVLNMYIKCRVKVSKIIWFMYKQNVKIK